jgi:hypothetical protein
MFALIFAARVVSLATALTLVVGVPASTSSSSPSEDPFTAFFNHDWASVGGWSLFISLCLLIVVGSFREWWAPGPRVKRLEKLVAQQQELIKQQSEQLGKSLDANELTKYVIEQVVPRPSSKGRRSTVAPKSPRATTGKAEP